MIPIILASSVCCWLERKTNALLPSSMKNFFPPAICLAVVVPLTFLVIGPVATWLSHLLANGYQFIYAFAPWLAGAVLDVFTVDPLPQDEPLWLHPQVVITPHMASIAPAEVIARQLLENIHRQQRALPLNNLVDKQRGY